MNTIIKIFLVSVLAFSGSQAMAANVTGLNTFSSGTPALASEVNGNFTNVKSAVDDNDSRLSNLESGAVTVHGLTFKLTGGSSCTQYNDHLGMYFPSGNSCKALASIQLPHNRKLTSLTCFVFDNTGTTLAINTYLSRATTTGNLMVANTLFLTPASINISNQNITDSTIANTGHEVIDNTKYSYYITASTGAGNAASLLRLNSCTVNYI